MLVLALLLWPVDWMRSWRYEAEARLANAVLSQAQGMAREGKSGLVIVHDAAGDRPAAVDAFGTLAAEASTLRTDGRITLWIEPPPAAFVEAGVSPPLLPIVGEIVVENGLARRAR